MRPVEDDLTTRSLIAVEEEQGLKVIEAARQEGVSETIERITISLSVYPDESNLVPAKPVLGPLEKSLTDIASTPRVTEKANQTVALLLLILSLADVNETDEAIVIGDADNLRCQAMLVLN